MQNQEFELTFAPDGSIKLEAKGFAGPTCLEQSQELSDLLGTVTQREFKPEYEQQVQIQQAKQIYL